MPLYADFFPSPLHTRAGTSDNPYLLLDTDEEEDYVVKTEADGTENIVNAGAGSSSEAALDLVTLSDDDGGLSDDAMVIDAAIQDASAAAVASATEYAIAAGQHDQPPGYTEPSFRERGDGFLGAISVMQGQQRDHWSQYVLRFFRDEIEQEIESRTAHLNARVNTLSNDTVTLRRLLSRLPNATRRFNFSPRSTWSKNKFRRTDFDTMAPAQVRTLARQLLASADGDLQHPIIQRNAVYAACIRRFQML
ncbi:hypothetical protein CF319_g8222 [Tilletia indica]|uniref:Uncharacterized protein n=1 Tax=Tilletia indica TaxID=43049 RepID=A0A177SYM1_9BASI|nr:hypothetical protein CF326_g9678 [Tilletia indica]KAE8217760.1 hypothetical protein CF319_g8222 [Tilletia indica]KAE8236232.1 hypothetical protein A4X13_0g9218 [Tilletia indica]